jgi:hypothetical protein
MSLTISDIPGGIALPDSADGTLEIDPNTVHIGGKVDVYVAGETEEASSQLDSLTDESPRARGFNAETDAALATVAAANIIIINDSSINAEDISPGWSLLLEEGEDAGSYRILAATGSAPGLQLTLDREVTGTQANLSWRIVDDISVDLMDPKAIKLEGSDLVTAAGGDVVTTTSGTNFIDANVLEGDVLRLEASGDLAGDYIIREVTATDLIVEPETPATAGAVSYSIFRQSEAINAPFVRVRSMELLDSGGSPTGTTIPYRDPVLVQSRAFQNEGARFSFNDLARVGLVSIGRSGASFNVGGLTLNWEKVNPVRAYEPPIDAGTFVFPVGAARTAAQVVAEFNADAALLAAGIRAIELNYGGLDYVGFFCEDMLRFTGTALTELDIDSSMTNGTIRTLSNTETMDKVLVSDAIEVLEGVNAGATGRVITARNSVLGGDVRVGNGPLSPVPGLYDNVLFNPEVGVRVRIGRPSVGSVRAYFLDPTSASFGYASTRFFLEGATRELVYQPDPENTRTLVPAPPLTELPNTGVTDGTVAPTQFTDATADFLLGSILPGDILRVLYQPITGSAALPTPLVAVGGLTLVLRFDSDPFLTVSFPFDMSRQDVADYINNQVGVEIASILGSGELRLQSKSRRIEVSGDSTALATLFLPTAGVDNDHPEQGEYIIEAVPDANTLTLATETSFVTVGTITDTQYEIVRYTQRISSTEMAENQDATGLYYVDVELRSTAPGNEFNIDAELVLEATGYDSDGYRLSVENSVLSYSRAEVALAEISRTILLVGSSDSPEEYVQLSQQNVQVNYDRSQIVDEVQSFVDADFDRVICEEILVRHLLPHYVNLNWAYVGGPSEAVASRALEETIDEVEPDTLFEVTDLVRVLDRRGSSSIYTIDSDALNGRRSPIMVVVYHDETRRIRAVIVEDFIESVRAQRYIPDSINLSRISAGGIR